MLRRNIDTSIGLVNGAIGEVVAVHKNDKKEIEKIEVRFGNTTHLTEKIPVNFEIFKGIFMTRKQFPIILSYAITIHKSQGISIKTALIDAGNLNFAYGQIYVALSRLTFLEGLHLINFDPKSIKADPRSITEYNRLRSTFRSDLPLFQVISFTGPSRRDQRWMISRNIREAQNVEEMEPIDLPLNIFGLYNEVQKNIDSANSTVQIFFHNIFLRKEINRLPNTHFLAKCLQAYMAQNLTNLINITEFSDFFASNKVISVDNCLRFISNQASAIDKCFNCTVSTLYHCSICMKSDVVETNEKILSLYIDDNSGNKIYKLDEIFSSNFDGKKTIKRHCRVCEKYTDVIMQKFVRANGSVIFVRITSIQIIILIVCHLNKII